ncbi:hypothetical protein HQ560_05340 [bacterium]|nr:hypothetical protein [bacterium]
MAVDGAKAVVSFTSVGGGLITKPFTDPVTPYGPTLAKRFGLPAVPESASQVRGFAVAGENKEFVWADAKLVGDTVVVSSPKVAKPVAVRYGWSNNPICNLYNKEGLPASPFRTDQYPGVTINNR